MPAEVWKRQELRDNGGWSLLVRSNGRQYKLEIRPVRDHNGRLVAHRPIFEPLYPINGAPERAERAALRAIDRISATFPAHDDPIEGDGSPTPAPATTTPAITPAHTR